MKIMKFGGSSMASAGSIRKVKDIILRNIKTNPVRIVVSACLGVTDDLLSCAKFASSGKKKYQTLATAIADRHIDLLQALTPSRTIEDSHPVCLMVQELNNLLEGLWLLHEVTASSLDSIASFGERLSAQILSDCINISHPAVFVDTRPLIVTDDLFMCASVQMEATRRRLRHWHTQFLQHTPKAIPVFTGFIGATVDGRTTTLGRNGSDYSAAIIGAALDVNQVEIWTDVDGVYSADPGMVMDAFVVPELSYEEAMELSYFGAKVLHPATLAPLRDLQIPIQVKNTFNPDAPGTRIAADKSEDRELSPASGITAIDGITLLSWTGRRQTDISPTIERLFRALAAANVNIFLISQASSQHTLTLAIRSSDTAHAIAVIREAFRHELKQQLLHLDKKSDQMIVAIVGDGMRGVPGIAGKMFHSLGMQGISIRAIAQGASEHNISLVINSNQEARALNIVHDAFFSREKKLGIILAGTGNVGGTLLTMLDEQSLPLRTKGFHLRLCGAANSRRMIFNNSGIDPATAKAMLEDDRQSRPFQMERLLHEVKHCDFLPLAFIDCTASSTLVGQYPAIIESGLHIITPNKKANVLPWPKWKKLMAEFKTHERHFLYQTNVGAGLPILSTIKDLLAGGDRIHSIEGILSGTLSWLFNHYDGRKPFAEVLQQTEEDGLTEPDPREDLSGADVARKLVIMAREMGLRMELKDVRVENLVPVPLRSGRFKLDFYRRFAKFEPAMRKKLSACRKKKAVLRYVGTLKNGKAFAGLQQVRKDHPLAFAGASDNIIAITTDRYSETPLVIQGLGAGAPVTAMGVFSDILRLLHYLPW